MRCEIVIVYIYTMKTIPFTFEGKDYEIRVESDGGTIRVRAFCDGVPANGYSHHISVMTALKIERCMELDAVKHLIETTKNEVTEKAWEGLPEALNQIEDYERKHPCSTERGF